jgi:hypothetical protein
MAGTQNISNLVVDKHGSDRRPHDRDRRQAHPDQRELRRRRHILDQDGWHQGPPRDTGVMGGSTFDEITVTGSTVGSGRLDLTTGTTNLGDGVGTDLSLSTTNTSDAALGLLNAGALGSAH